MDYLGKIERQLDLPPAEKEQAIQELKFHYDEIRNELISSGADPKQADDEAARRLGPPDEIVTQLTAAHSRSSWKSTALAVLPFIIWAGIWVLLPSDSSLAPSITDLIITAFAATMLIGSIHQFLHGKRPLWTATWFSLGIFHATSAALPAICRLTRTPLDSPRGVVIGMLVIISTIGIVNLFACFHQPKRLALVALLTLVCIVPSIMMLDRSSPGATANGWLNLMKLLMLVNINILLILAAINVFQNHRYGSSELASLFIFPIITSFVPEYGTPGSPSVFVWAVFYVVLVMLFARGVNWKQKMAVLTIGAALQAVLEFNPTISGRMQVGTTVAYTIIYSILVLFPMLLDLGRRQRLARAIAQ